MHHCATFACEWINPWTCPIGGVQKGRCYLSVAGRMTAHDAGLSSLGAKKCSRNWGYRDRSAKYSGRLTSTLRSPCAERMLLQFFLLRVRASLSSCRVCTAVLSGQVLERSESSSPGTRQIGHGSFPLDPRISDITHLLVWYGVSLLEWLRWQQKVIHFLFFVVGR